MITGDIKFDVGVTWSLMSIMLTGFTAILFRLRHHYIIWLVLMDFFLNSVMQIFVRFVWFFRFPHRFTCLLLSCISLRLMHRAPRRR